MTFWSLFAIKTEAPESAIVADDAGIFSGIVNELATTLVAAYPQFNLNIGSDPLRLSILSLPGAERLAEQFVGNAPQIENWLIQAGIPAHEPLGSICVSDDTGASLDIPYADLDARVLSLDTDFDPSGPQSHLYEAVAENEIFTVLGGWPQVLSNVV